MALNFNVDPYYDDFDATKNFHRILFKPGYAVQARELTQAQTILQDQITKFADNIFKQNSPVTGGQITTNLNCNYIKVQDTDSSGKTIDVFNFLDKIIQDETGTIIAKVIAVEESTLTSYGTGDPATLIVSYKTGNKFADSSVIYDSLSPTTTAVALLNGATGSSSVASIAQGVFYISGNYDRGDGIIVNNGTFVQVNPQTTVLSKYDSVPNVRVGLNITETIYDYVSDSSLLDPAIGASNYKAPGADRYVINLTLESRPLELGDDDNFIQLLRIEDGNVYRMVDGSVYNVIDDYFAKRDYETNGDYIVNDFKLTPNANTLNPNTYTMSIGKGLAYVHGYRVENPSPIDIESNRARTTESRTGVAVYIDNGSYFYVNSVSGANGGSFFTNTAGNAYLAAQPIDIHCVSSANVNVASNIAYSSTVVSSGYLRNIQFAYNTSDLLPNTSVYKFYTNDLQVKQLTANAASTGTISSINFPSTYSSIDGAYVGVSISIISGTSSGDFRTITSYNGSTRTANVNTNWSVIPDTTTKFNLNFDLKNSKSLFYVNSTASPVVYYGTATIDNLNKNAAGEIGLQNPSDPEMLFKIGNPYVSSLSSSSYTTTLVTTGVLFNPGSSPAATISFSGALTPVVTTGTLTADVIKQNFTIIVTNKGSNSKINVGDNLIWTTTANASRTISTTTSAVNFYTASTDLSSFTATVIQDVFVSNANETSTTKVLKQKNLYNANTTVVKVTSFSGGAQVGSSNTWIDITNNSGQIFIGKGGLVSPGNKQSLYISDVKSIVKIYDTGSSGTIPTVGSAIPNYSDVTSNYSFDNGQRDSFYDHASITLRPGAPQPSGNLLILINYYVSVGNGYASVLSYTTGNSVNEDYKQIPNYQAKDGIIYSLRDCIDFRPIRVNASTTLTYPTSDGIGQVLLPVDLSNFITTYAYYLGRKDLLTLSKDKSFQIIEGSPALQPIMPSAPEGSLVIANMIHNPYTGFLPTETNFLGDLSIDKVKHKRYTMQDIAGLENRINQVEYYTALSSLEQNAQTLQTPDTYGLNRFKNGILVDDFSSFATADTINTDFSATINKRTRQMTASQTVNNYPLKLNDLSNILGNLDATSKSNLNYAINRDGLTNYITLPYTTATITNQKIASRVVNLNPFSVPNAEGTISLTPNMDNWVDTSYAPSLLITDPNLQVFSYTGKNTVLSSGDWKTVSGTTSSVTSSSRSTSTGAPVEGHNINWSPFGYVGYIPTTTTTTSTTSTTTTSIQNQNNIIGPYSSIGNTYGINNGYITDVSILPWIRTQAITFRSKGLLYNTSVNAFFDGKNVNNYIRKPNIIELTGVTGTFADGDVIGYQTGGSFTATGIVTGSYSYPGTANVRLYINSDPYTATAYTNNGVIKNAFFNSSKAFVNSTASGNLSKTTHYGAAVRNVSGNTITLSSLAPASNNYYGTTGNNTLYIVAGTGAGLSSAITAYNGITKVISLSTTLACANGDLYSIGETSSPITTNENGFIGGVFHIPPNTFHNGERIFRIDNSLPVGNFTTATTFSQSTFYASGLSTKAQQIDFGASPSGAKGTFTSTSSKTTVSTSTQTSKNSVTTYSRWDPVAQSFMIDNSNYPNGAFLSDVSFFFKSKPSSGSGDRSPVTLSILATLNGYPSGETLDHSVVTLPWESINTSATPHYLDSTTATNFKFPVPIYIQPNVLYAFMLKSSSDQYNLYVAASGDNALASSVKNLPTDPAPTVITKISSAPYVGGLFISQNSQTWTADQNQALMFVLNNCNFTTSVTPSVQYVIPQGLPQRTLVSQSIDNFNGNTIFNSVETIATSNVLVDAFNITTTEFVPTTTSTSYTYRPTLKNGTILSPSTFTPGKYATATYDDIYLSDGQGERILLANTSGSLSVFATLRSGDPAVSPLISDAGLSAYAIKWNINNCELTNSVITLANTGSGYNIACTKVTITGGGVGGSNVTTPAIVAANIVGGVIQSIYVTNGGSGYITTPTITIADSNTTPGTGASAYITGETSKNGGPATAKYVTKKVSLDTGFDSGDLTVFMTAYRPVNTDILVYYKILNRNDTQSFDDSSWQLMTCTRSGSSVYSKTRNDVYEYTFAPGSNGLEQGYVQYTSTNGQTYYKFSQFAIKIVLTSSDATYTPFLNDLRCLALPSTINKSAGNQ